VSSSIPLNKLDEGIQRAIDNATRYLNDAVFLYDNKKYQSSILLSMLSYEARARRLNLATRSKSKNEKGLPISRNFFQQIARARSKGRVYSNT